MEPEERNHSPPLKPRKGPEPLEPELEPERMEWKAAVEPPVWLEMVSGRLTPAPERLRKRKNP